MSPCVREAVQDNKYPLPPADNQIFGAIRLILRGAEHTSVFFFVILYVFHAPGGPKVIHNVCGLRICIVANNLTMRNS